MRRKVAYRLSATARRAGSSPSGEPLLVLSLVESPIVPFKCGSFLIIIQSDCLLALEAVEESHGSGKTSRAVIQLRTQKPGLRSAKKGSERVRVA